MYATKFKQPKQRNRSQKEGHYDNIDEYENGEDEQLEMIHRANTNPFYNSNHTFNNNSGMGGMSQNQSKKEWDLL